MLSRHPAASTIIPRHTHLFASVAVAGIIVLLVTPSGLRLCLVP